MSKISFKNFRGFIDFPEMEFGGITFLVGKNNSGKSTAVKALRLMTTYLQSDNIFRVDLQKMVGLDDYDKIKNRETKDDFIKFKYSVNDYVFELTIDQSDFASNRVNLIIEDVKNGFSFHFTEDEYEEDGFPNFGTFCRISSADFTIKGLRKFIHFNSSYDNLSIEALIENIKLRMVDAYLFYQKNELSEEHEKTYIKRGLGSKIYLANNLDKSSIDEDMQILDNVFSSLDDLSSLLSGSSDVKNVFYLDSLVKMRSNILNIKDEDSNLARAIAKYINKNIGQRAQNPKGFVEFFDKNHIAKDSIKSFILKWMSKDCFDIGEDFDIHVFEEGIYSMYIIKNEQRIPLSEMGLGVIRIISSLFVLAEALYKCSGYLYIFEESELNLHPAWQSKLCDLFLEVTKITDNRVQIVLETHSEYLIRRSQVLVAENKFESKPNQNPFKIYYFNDKGDKKPYQIKYDEDGFLKNGFGPGFFDEASSNTLELLRLKKVKLN